MRAPFRTHQRQAFDFTLQSKEDACALFMEMRLGKSRTILRILEYKQALPVLVACPYSAILSWKDDIMLEHKTFSLLLGSKEQRLINARQEADVYIVNKEGFLALPELARGLLPINSVVLDESTFIKHPTAKVTKFYLKNFRNVKYRAILTGTPADPNSLLDYVTQLLFLSKDLLPVKSYWEFRHKFCHQAGFRWVVGKKGVALLKAALARVAFTMTLEQAGYSVPKVDLTRIVKYPPVMYREYSIIDKQFKSELSATRNRTVFAGEKWLWMRRLCSGFSTAGDCVLFEHKIEELLSLVNGELKGAQVVIFANYVSEIAEIVKRIPGSDFIAGEVSKPQRENIVNRFQQHQLQRLVVQSTTMRFGADLSASSTGIFFSLPSVPETFKQCKSRFIKLSKKETILYLYLIAENTLEEDLLFALQNDQSIFDVYNKRRSHNVNVPALQEVVRSAAPVTTKVIPEVRKKLARRDHLLV